MKLLVTSDWHEDAFTAGVPRLDELVGYVDHLVGVCRQEKVDLVLNLGDVFDPGNPRECLYQTRLIEMASALTRASRLGSLWLTGNHDVLDCYPPLSTLSPLAALSKAWRLKVWPGEQELEVVDMPRLVEMPHVNLLCLPYVSRAAETSGAYQKALSEALEAARGKPDPLLVLSHLSLPNMHPGSEAEMLRGREMPFPLEQVLELRPAVVLQGHYHARQSMKLKGLQVEVVGAPARYTFGERDDGERGFLLVEV